MPRQLVSMTPNCTLHQNCHWNTQDHTNITGLWSSQPPLCTDYLAPSSCTKRILDLSEIKLSTLHESDYEVYFYYESVGISRLTTNNYAIMWELNSPEEVRVENCMAENFLGKVLFICRYHSNKLKCHVVEQPNVLEILQINMPTHTRVCFRVSWFVLSHNFGNWLS